MAIPASTFAARYKLACFYIANHLFETVVQTSAEIDLKDIKQLQRDDGFFMSSLRLVEQLTAFRSNEELELLNTKIEASGSMYFKKSILTAVVNQGNQTSTDDCQNEKTPKLENLYDRFIVKFLYDSYFSAYVADEEPLDFLDTHQAKPSDDLVSIFELGVFDTDTLRNISDILDFTTKDGANAAILSLQANPRYNTYKHFFGLVAKCI